MVPTVPPSQSPFMTEPPIDPALLCDPVPQNDSIHRLAKRGDYRVALLKHETLTSPIMPPPRKTSSRKARDRREQTTSRKSKDRREQTTGTSTGRRIARRRRTTLFEDSDDENTQPTNWTEDRHEMDRWDEMSLSIRPGSKTNNRGHPNDDPGDVSAPETLIRSKNTKNDKEPKEVSLYSSGRDASSLRLKRRRIENRSSSFSGFGAIQVARMTDMPVASPGHNVIRASNTLLECLEPVNVVRSTEPDLATNPYAKALFDHSFPSNSEQHGAESVQSQKRRHSKKGPKARNHTSTTWSSSIQVEDESENHHSRPLNSPPSPILSPLAIADLLSLHNDLITRYRACNNAVRAVGIKPYGHSFSAVKGRIYAPPKLLHNIKMNKLTVASHIVQMQEYEKFVCQQTLVKKREYLRDQARQIEKPLETEGGIKIQKGVGRIFADAKLSATQANAREISKILAELEGSTTLEKVSRGGGTGSDEDESDTGLRGDDSSQSIGLAVTSDAHDGQI